MPFDPIKIKFRAEAYTAAWNSGKPEAVAAFFADPCQIVINGGDPYLGRSAVAEMAAGFFADVPDLTLTCDLIRCAGPHVAYFWSFTGHHAETKNPLHIVGWEEWDLNEALEVVASRGWFDADAYAAQVEGR